MGRQTGGQRPEGGPGDAELARRVLGELWARWGAAAALEYRSEAFLHHAGEFALTVRVHARLRRPGSARVLFFTRDWPEAARVRVCDGRVLYDRRIGGRGPAFREGYAGRLTRDIPHPLDEAGYCIDQFFERRPFLSQRPPWGDGAAGAPPVTAERVPAPDFAPPGSAKHAWRLVIEAGRWRDTLLLDGLSYAPLRLVRVGDHAGRVQELLRETFVEVIPDAGRRFAPVTFAWTEDDERGALPPADRAWLEGVRRTMGETGGRQQAS